MFAHGPTARNIPNFFRNLVWPGRLSASIKPDVILSTGGGLAVPFFVLGRLIGVRLVYVESFTRVQRPALTGRLVYPLAQAFFVQWPHDLAPQAGCLRRERRVIFVTCGSSPIRFERMMQALEALPADELIVQHGPDPSAGMRDGVRLPPLRPYR